MNTFVARDYRGIPPHLPAPFFFCFCKRDRTRYNESHRLSQRIPADCNSPLTYIPRAVKMPGEEFFGSVWVFATLNLTRIYHADPIRCDLSEYSEFLAQISARTLLPRSPFSLFPRSAFLRRARAPRIPTYCPEIESLRRQLTRDTRYNVVSARRA